MAKAREEFYRGQGVPPGPPTMQGVNGEPDRTGNAYPNAPLGSYDVPKTWPGSPRFAEAGGPPGPPIQWDKRDLTSANAHAGDDYANAPPPPENELYYYHTDHLGSTSYIIDRQGEVMQFACYLPYGEALADEHTVTVTQPYKFSGKELDGETGLYYFGTRYYNPKWAIWYGVDALAEKREWISPYNFCSLNPINRTDPTGTLDDWIYSKETETYVWDGNVTKPSKTPAGHEYVGASLKDVATHFEGNNPIASIFTSPKFGADRTPWPGEISPTDNLTSLEFWLRSPSESVGEGVGKIAANIGYSIANSPYSLVRGQTLGGTPLIGREKMDAFVDVVPGLLTGGLTKAGLAVKTTAKGVPGFNQFVKRSLGITTKEGLPAGTKWQQRAGRLFQTNKVIQQGLKDFGKVRNVQNVGNTTKNELEK